MENVVDSVGSKKKILKKVKSTYSWAIAAIIFQIIISTVITMGGNMVLGGVLGVKYAAEGVDKTEVMKLVQEEASNYTMLIVGISYIVANTTAAFFCVKKAKAGSFKKWFNKPKFTALDTIMGCFAVTGIANLVVTALSLLGTVISNTGENLSSAFNSGLFSDKPVAVVGTILYMALIGPITEEILCRGAIMNITSTVSRRFALVASAVMFGLMHANLIQIINATIMGLILAYVAEKTKSLITTCILHIFNNSFAVVLSFIFEKVVSPDNAELVSNIITIAIIVIGVVCAVLVFRKYGMPTDEDGMEVNELLTKEELSSVSFKKGELTVKPFFLNAAFFVVLIYAVLLSAAAAMM